MVFKEVSATDAADERVAGVRPKPPTGLLMLVLRLLLRELPLPKLGIMVLLIGGEVRGGGDKGLNLDAEFSFKEPNDELMVLVLLLVKLLEDCGLGEVTGIRGLSALGPAAYEPLRDILNGLGEVKPSLEVLDLAVSGISANVGEVTFFYHKQDPQKSLGRLLSYFQYH